MHFPLCLHHQVAYFSYELILLKVYTAYLSFTGNISDIVQTDETLVYFTLYTAHSHLAFEPLHIVLIGFIKLFYLSLTTFMEHEDGWWGICLVSIS